MQHSAKLHQPQTLREAFSSVDSVHSRTQLLLQVVRNFVASILCEETIEGRNRVRDEIHQILYIGASNGEFLFSETDRKIILDGLERRLGMVTDSENANGSSMDFMKVEATVTQEWAPDFRKSLTS